jgi:MFS family permease
LTIVKEIKIDFWLLRLLPFSVLLNDCFFELGNITDLGYSKEIFLLNYIFCLVFAHYYISAVLADKVGRRKMLITATTAIAIFGFISVLYEFR